MGGFFPINPGGGAGGGQNPDTAFISVQLRGNELVFTRGNGQTTNVPLSVITNGLVEDVELNANGTDLTITKKDGSTKTVDLTPLLGVREFSYDNNTRVITVIDQNGNRVEVDLSKFARLDEDNIFSGDSNIFKELSLGLPNKTNYIIPSGTYGPAVTQIKTGNRAITSHTVATSNGYVKNLVARVDNVTLGEKINVNIWEVTKGQDRSQDVPKLLHSNLEVEVISSTGYFATGFAIKCPINKKYNKETYFIYQILQPAKLFRATNINPTSDDYIRIEENVDVTTATIILSRNDLVGVYLLELGDVNIGDLLDNNNGTVTSVNGQTPNDLGAVTVDAEHINYDNATSQLNSTDVQGAIDEVDGKIQNTYVESNFNPVNGELTLTKANGQDDVLDLSSLLFDVTFDDTNNTLNKVQNGVTTPVIDHVVTEWDDLEFVSKTKNNIRNIFNKHTQIVKDRYYTPVSGGGYQIHNNTNWDLAYMPVVPGQEITLIKNAHDSQNYGVFNEQNIHQQHISSSGQLVNGMRVYRMTIDATLPQGNTYYLLINMHKTGNNPIDPNKVMVFDGNIIDDDLPKEYIPYATHGSIYIDGNEVVHTFNPAGSSLVSQNTQDAIIELDRKITTTNESSIKTINSQTPDTQGNIDLELENAQDVINFKVGAQTINTITYATQPEVDAIKNNIIVF